MTRPPLAAGVTHALARWRSAYYRDLRYRLSAVIDDDATTFQVHLHLAVHLSQAVDFVLDWRPADAANALVDVTVNGHVIRVETLDEHLVLPAGSLRAGDNAIDLSVSAPIRAAGTAITRYRDATDGADTVYSLFVPADACAAFPCVDQPDLKGRFEFSLESPADWMAVSNAPLVRVEPAARGRAVHRFEPTVPISTYLFAFAAGPFVRVDGARSDGPGLVVRRSRVEAARGQAASILDLAWRALQWLTDWLEAPYPFGKLDLVLVPGLPFGGMEHAGAIFLHETTALLPDAAAARDHRRRSHLLLHEIAHQWVGNLVTMRWFDDLWLKEGFANYLAAKLAEALVDGPDAWVAFHAAKTRAIELDATAGAVALWQPLEQLADAKSLYGPIVYEKAPAVLRQLERRWGEPVLRRAVAAWIARCRFGTSDWRDLVKSLEAATGEGFGAWASSWILQSGVPTGTWTFRRDTGIVVQAIDPDGRARRWPQRLAVRWVDADGVCRDVDIDLADDYVRIPGTTGAARPRLVILDHGDHGYLRVVPNSEAIDDALAQVATLTDPLDRALVWTTLWEGVREARLAPVRFVDAAIGALGSEWHPVLEDSLLGRIDLACRRWVGEADRRTKTESWERTLLSLAQAAGNPERRAVLLTTFIAIVRSNAGLRQVGAWLHGETAFPIALQARHAVALAVARLTAGEGDEGDERRALRRWLGPGESAACDPVLRAAVPDAARKRRILDAWTGGQDIPEAWIEAALTAFNDPRHAALTAPLFDRALGSLAVLKRRYRIFLVDRWLDAFTAGQRSPEALAILRRRRDDPELPPDLRLKLLRCEDALARTVRVLETFGGSP